MKVEVISHFINNGEECGEYYIYDSNGYKTLCVQNGSDIRVIPHLRGRKVSECVSTPTNAVIEAILGADKER